MHMHKILWHVKLNVESQEKKKKNKEKKQQVDTRDPVVTFTHTQYF